MIFRNAITIKANTTYDMETPRLVLDWSNIPSAEVGNRLETSNFIDGNFENFIDIR